VDAEFETFDVLSDPVVRDEIKKYAGWPTIPQCYIAGEFVGGSDILLELFESGASCFCLVFCLGGWVGWGAWCRGPNGMEELAPMFCWILSSIPPPMLGSLDQ
jgi:hypothetical protein